MLYAGKYQLVVDDRRDCKIEYDEVLEITPDITCNTVFTPDGDGENDEWESPFDNNAKIVNQKGDLIAEINPGETWDGTDINGNPVPTGLYLIEDESGDYITLTVLR